MTTLRRLDPASARSNGSADVGVSIVVPVYNEEQSVEQLVAEISDALAGSTHTWELVFVDDGSIDSTFAVLARLHHEHEAVRAVRLRRNFGKAAALAAGFREARGRLIVTMDGDLQDDPREIPRLLAKLDEGYDLVSGWKSDRHDPWSRRAASRVFNGVTARVSGVRLHDMNCGLKAFRAAVVHDLDLYGEMHRFIPVLAHQRGYRLTEIAVNHRERAYGQSRYGLERYLRGFLDLLTVSFLGRYRERPLHLFGSIGMLLSTVGVVILSYLTLLKVLGQPIGHRPLLMLGVLLVISGLQFFFVGLISELITAQRAETGNRNRRVEDVLR